MSGLDPLAERAIARSRRALAVAAVRIPELAGLSRSVHLVASARVPTAAVTESERVALNPGWVDALADDDLVFVVAHELLHLLLRTHARAEPGYELRRFNVAHDAVINDLLRRRLGRPPPAGGVDVPGAADRSGEALARFVDEPDADPLHGDVLDPRREGLLLGDAPHRGVGARGGWERARVRVGGETVALDFAAKVTALLGWSRLVAPPPSRRRRAVPALAAVAHGGARGEERRRSFARASRRGGDGPGRAREGARLAVLLDTSSSMTLGLDDALAIARWLADAAPGGVRVVTCDGRVRDDLLLGSGGEPIPIRGGGDVELVVPPEVCEGCRVHHAYHVDGAVTDLGPGLDLLGREAPEIVVLTDGRLAAPRVRPSRGVAITWVLVGDHAPGPALPGRTLDLREP